jgi:hypothetical protein
MFVCSIPGADDGTMFLHAALHYGLAAVFVAVGAVFLVLAVTAYRSPSDGGAPSAGPLQPPAEA